MIKSDQSSFNPDYVVHPGEVLEEILEARGIQKGDFAKRCGLSVKTVSQIINKKHPVTPETSLQFERALGISADIWNGLDSKYRLHEVRQLEINEKPSVVEWVNKFPLLQLKKRNIISETRDKWKAALQLFRFFGVSNVEAWNEIYGNIPVSYRKSNAFKSSQHSVLAWLRIAEIKAEDIETKSYDRRVFIKNINKIRKLTRTEPNEFEPKMKNLCKESGVALVFVSELPKTRLCGATRWLTNKKALLALSLRYKTDDQFWFSFFHEAGHILLHDKHRVFIDEDKKKKDTFENEANKFAQDILVQDEAYADFVKKGKFYKNHIIDFAEALNIAPGVIVGMLQHDELIPFKWHNGLKNRITIKEE